MVRRFGVPVVALLVLVAIGVYVIVRDDDPDIELTGGAMTRALDGTRIVGKPEGVAERFAGRGRVAAVFSVESARNEPLRLSVPRAQRRELGRVGIGVRVGFVPLPAQAVLPNRIVPRELRRDLPPKGKPGALVHLFDLRDCKRGSLMRVTHFGLDVAERGHDPHPAMVDVKVTGEKRELWTYQRTADAIRLRLRCR